jgi:hypothetical protein
MSLFKIMKIFGSCFSGMQAEDGDLESSFSSPDIIEPAGTLKTMI